MKNRDLEKATRIALLSYVDMLQNTLNTAVMSARDADELRKENKLSEIRVHQLQELNREGSDTIHNLHIKLSHLEDEVLKTSKQYQYAMEWSEAQSEKIASLEQSAHRKVCSLDRQISERSAKVLTLHQSKIKSLNSEIKGLKGQLRTSDARSKEEWERAEERLNQAWEEREERVQELLLARESLKESKTFSALLADELHKVKEKLSQRTATMKALEKMLQQQENDITHLQNQLAEAEKNKTYPVGGPEALIERLTCLMEDNPIQTMAQISKEQHRSLQRLVGMWTSMDHAGSSFNDKSSEDKGE